MKKTFLPFFGLLSQAFADTAPLENPPSVMQQDPNPSSRFGTSDKANVFLQPEIIWMIPLQDDLCKNYKKTADETIVSFANPKFFPAMRITLGFNTPQDGWDTSLIYTAFNYKHNNGYKNDYYTYGDTTALFDGAISNKFIFNQGDVDLGRMMKISRKMNIRPHIGLRGLFLSQKQTIKGTLKDNSYALDTAKIQGTLAGLEGGFDILFKLSKSYSFYGSYIASSLVDGRKYKKSFQNGASPKSLSFMSKSQINYTSKIVYALDFMMGFRWDRNFNNDRFHFAFNLGYEHHNYINLNFSDPAVSNQFSNDFSMQGVAFGMRLDF